MYKFTDQPREAVIAAWRRNGFTKQKQVKEGLKLWQADDPSRSTTVPNWNTIPGDLQQKMCSSRQGRKSRKEYLSHL